MLRYICSRTKFGKGGHAVARPTGLCIRLASLAARQRLFSSSFSPQPAKLPQTVDSLESLASALGNADSEWTAKEEQQAKIVLFKCRRLVADSSNSTSTADIRRICLVADRLGSRMVQKNRTSFAPDLFVDYLDFYAALGRPDVTQSAFGRIASQWRRPSILSYAAQQRALLRFHANGADLLQRTMNNEDGQNNAKAIVDSRLRYRTVAQIIDSALEKDRRTRRFVKALEYGSYMALAALVAKWTWIGNSVFMAGFPLLPKTLASIAALLAAAAGVRFALRHSIMGSLTTPLLSDLQGGSHSTAASEQLSVESDADALRRLRQAFPASPSDETMAEINEMISATHSADGSAIGGPRLSWKLRLALMWSRFARRFAVVEPALVSQHELCQFLAVSWLREIVRMFAPEKRTVTDATRQVSSKAIEEFVEFLQTRFTDIPLVLGHDDIAAISRFVTVEADAATVDMFLDLATRGYLALSRGQQGAERRHHALAAASGGSFGKQQAAAAILAYCGCIQSATQMGPETSEQLYASLQKLIASTLMPISRSLCQIAFQGAAALNSLDKRQSTMGALVKSLETRYKQKDPYLLHLLSGSGQTTSESPRTVPIVRCISDYIAALARRPDANYVCAFVQRWIQMGILSPAAAEQCLLAATNAALSLSDRSRISAENSRNYVRLEQLADLACKIASGSVSSSENSRTALASVALPMYALLTKILGEFSRSIEPEDSRISAENVLDALSRTVLDPPALRNFAPQDFNEAAIRLLLTLVSRQRETKSKVELISRAIRYLDLMRHLNQTPAQRTLEQLCAMAESLKMDVSAINSYWNDIIKQSDKNKKVSLFAKSLL